MHVWEDIEIVHPQASYNDGHAQEHLHKLNNIYTCNKYSALLVTSYGTLGRKYACMRMQGAVHMVLAARVGCKRVMFGTGWANSCLTA